MAPGCGSASFTPGCHKKPLDASTVAILTASQAPVELAPEVIRRHRRGLEYLFTDNHAPTFGGLIDRSRQAVVHMTTKPVQAIFTERFGKVYPFSRQNIALLPS